MPNGDRDIRMKMHEEIMRMMRHIENVMWTIGALLITLSFGSIYVIIKPLLSGDDTKKLIILSDLSDIKKISGLQNRILVDKSDNTAIFWATLIISLSLVVAWILYLGFLKFGIIRLRRMANFARGLTPVTNNFWNQIEIAPIEDEKRENIMDLRPNWFRKIYRILPVFEGFHILLVGISIVICIILVIITIIIFYKYIF